MKGSLKMVSIVSTVLFCTSQLMAVEIDGDSLFVPKTFTSKNSFTSGVEGPAVDDSGNLYAVNFRRKSTIGKVTPRGRATTFVTLSDGSIGNGIRFNSKGDMFIADYTNHNILKVDMNSKAVSVFAHDSRMNQPNDIAIADNDVIYASDPNWSKSTGNLWMIDTSGTTHLLASNMGTTNGVEVSPDNKTLYVNESVQHRVLAFDILPDGKVSNKRVLKQYNDSVLDGMRCDSLGNIYIACHNKGMIYIISPEGETIREIKMLGTKVTNIAFGGTDGKTCYVTVAGNGNIETFRTNIPGRSWIMRNKTTGIDSRQSSTTPHNFKLWQNYPNPFNPQTIISYELKSPSRVELNIYNSLGQKITQLTNKKQSPGSYSVIWDASKCASGIYLCCLQSDNFSEAKKMILLK